MWRALPRLAAKAMLGLLMSMCGLVHVFAIILWDPANSSCVRVCRALKQSRLAGGGLDCCDVDALCPTPPFLCIGLASVGDAPWEADVPGGTSCSEVGNWPLFSSSSSAKHAADCSRSPKSCRGSCLHRTQKRECKLQHNAFVWNFHRKKEICFSGILFLILVLGGWNMPS